eukprot:1942444-Pyramimonas_sp.AAC.1
MLYFLTQICIALLPGIDEAKTAHPPQGSPLMGLRCYPLHTLVVISTRQCDVINAKHKTDARSRFRVTMA